MSAQIENFHRSASSQFVRNGYKYPLQSSFQLWNFWKSSAFFYFWEQIAALKEISGQNSKESQLQQLNLRIFYFYFYFGAARLVEIFRGSSGDPWEKLQIFFLLSGLKFQILSTIHTVKTVQRQSEFDKKQALMSLSSTLTQSILIQWALV